MSRTTIVIDCCLTQWALLTPYMRDRITRDHGGCARLYVIEVMPCYGGVLATIEKLEDRSAADEEARLVFFAPNGELQWDQRVGYPSQSKHGRSRTLLCDTLPAI